jgi:hypothetical protein
VGNREAEPSILEILVLRNLFSAGRSLFFARSRRRPAVASAPGLGAPLLPERCPETNVSQT